MKCACWSSHIVSAQCNKWDSPCLYALCSLREGLLVTIITDYHTIYMNLSCYSSIFIYFATYKVIFIGNSNSKTDRCWFSVLLSDTNINHICIITCILILHISNFSQLNVHFNNFKRKSPFIYRCTKYVILMILIICMRE